MLCEEYSDDVNNSKNYYRFFRVDGFAAIVFQKKETKTV
jgi:hypothetical protein